MRSNNPVFARSSEFNGKANSYGNPTYSGNGETYAGYGKPSQWGVGSAGGAGGAGSPTHAEAGSGPMTIDTVVQKTGLTLVVLVITGALTWVLTGNPIDSQQSYSSLMTLAMVGGLAGFVLAMVNSFKKVISPALVLAYAGLEGIFIGAMSKAFEAAFGPGVVTGAVLGTVAAFGATLAAYKFFNISVGSKFRAWVTAAMFGFVAVSLLDFMLGFFGGSFGFNGLGTLGLLSSLFGVGLAVLMLILDFDYVEKGIAAGLPERESWRAAFGLTVTIVWLYIELLRILAIFTRR